MIKTNLSLLGLALMISLGTGLTGCGGSGDSSSSGMAFPSNAVLAEATLENGQKVEAAVTQNQMNNVPALNSLGQTPQTNLVTLSSNLSQTLMHYTKMVDLNTYALNEVINKTIPCTYGGSMSLNGSGNDASGGTVTLRANQCQEAYATINGSLQISISNLNTVYDAFTDYNYQFTSEYTVTTTDGTGQIAKNSYINLHTLSFDAYGDPQTFTLAISMQVSDGTNISGLRNCLFYYDLSSSYPSVYQTQGDIYIDNLTSYVSYDQSYDMSQTPFIFDYYGTVMSGEALYTMANGGHVKISVENNTPQTYVDANGDGIYELHE